MTTTSRRGRPVESASTIPSAWYFGRRHHEREIREVFARTWQAVARTEQLANPGDHVTAVVAGEPLVVVRGRDRTLRALSNVCRHRAGTVVPGDGNSKAFSCTYHGWAYALDGSLLAAPEMEGVKGFRKEACRLPSFRSAEWGGLVFARISRGGPALARSLGRLPELAARTAFGAMRFDRRDVYEIACNWKVYVDNYLEGYHIPKAHPGLHEAIDYGRYATLLDGPLVVQDAPARGGGCTGPEYLYVWVWPNLMLNVSPDYAQINVILPDGPERTRCVFDYYFPENTGGRRDAAIEWSDGIQREDIAICEAVQRNLRSRTYRSGRYSAKRETGVWRFHQLLRAALA